MKSFTVMVWHAKGYLVQKVNAPDSRLALEAGICYLKQIRPEVYSTIQKLEVIEIRNDKIR